MTDNLSDLAHDHLVITEFCERDGKPLSARELEEIAEEVVEMHETTFGRS